MTNAPLEPRSGNPANPVRSHNPNPFNRPFHARLPTILLTTESNMSRACSTSCRYPDSAALTETFRVRRPAVAILATVIPLPAFAQAQLLIENATVCLDGRRIVENADVLIRGDRIAAVATDLDPRGRVTRIDATGAFITPGLIDAWGATAMRTTPSGGSPDQLAFDAFDRYDAEAFRAAFAGGVTSLYISAASGPGIGGIGSVVRLAPGDGPSAGDVLLRDAALCIDMGSAQSPTARIRTFHAVRKALKDAIAYRDSLDEYAHDLEAYEKKLAERAKANDKKDAGKPDQPPGAQPERPPQPASDQTGKKPEEELKKPAEPRRNRQAEVLLRAIDREIPVRFRADRDADIINALTLADEFNLRAVIEGGAEAHLVAADLAERNVPVVLDHAGEHSRAIPRRRADALAILTDAGVTARVASGDASPRFLLRSIQRAGSPDALAHCTADAAAFLNVADSIGSLRQGRYADLVIWSGDPREPGARVRRVYVSGQLMWQSDGEGGGS